MLHAGQDETELPMAEVASTPEGASAMESAASWARFTFVVLFAMNLLDYTDRWVLSAVLPNIQKTFAIDNFWGGMLTTFFLISYSVISPVMGWLGDRTRRTWLLGLGVGVWSLATLGTGLARNYNDLVLARSFLGIGEATYGVLAPTILMDLFARSKRARVMSGFYVAMPVGGALGLGLGGYIASIWGWRASFFIVGAPGLLAAFAALLLPEPVRGSSEGVDVKRLKSHEKAGATKEDYLDLMVNSSYTYSVFGMAMYTFAIGGLGVWLPKFLMYTRGIAPVTATTVLGIVTALAAIVGMSVGGWLADRLARTNPRALFVVPGVAMLASIPFILIALSAKVPAVIFVAVFLAEMLMFINTGPCNAVIANVVAPNMRAVAFAVAVFAVHFLGDIWSPPLMGKVADLFGAQDTMASWIGKGLKAIGAVPVPGEDGRPQNMVAGLLIVVPMVLLSGIVLLAGARHIPREMALMLAKLKAAPPNEPNQAV
jgi:MFS family permease